MDQFDRNLVDLVRRSHELNFLEQADHFPKIVPLRILKASLPGLRGVSMSATPHYRYFRGPRMFDRFLSRTRSDLSFYFEQHLRADSARKIAAAERLATEVSAYLGGDFRQSPIVVDAENYILDGHLRVARLLALGATHALVVEPRAGAVNYARRSLSLDASSESEGQGSQVSEYLAEIKDAFPEWYSPLEMGPYVLPKRVYPKFNEVWDFDDGEGIRNWERAIRHVIPDMSGKVVLDIGSNVGLFSIEMARLGANVCGVDRGPRVIQANNPWLGAQSVPNQAYAVRNVHEVFCGKRFPQVAFAELDLMDFDFSHTQCDLFFSCRVLYHLGRKRMEEVIQQISENIPELILQSNEGHAGRLGKIARMDFHKTLLRKYGYQVKREWAPAGSVHPVIYATRQR
jgi:SAM-dependent methyltransferase